MKYLRSVTFRSKDIVIRKSEFVAKSQFLSFCANYAKIIRKNAHCAKITQFLRKKWGHFVETLWKEREVHGGGREKEEGGMRLR